MRDFRAELTAGECPDNMGCNAMQSCMCAFAEEAVAEIERLRAALRIAKVMVHDEPVAHALYSNGRTLIQILERALALEQKGNDNA